MSTKHTEWHISILLHGEQQENVALQQTSFQQKISQMTSVVDCVSSVLMTILAETSISNSILELTGLAAVTSGYTVQLPIAHKPLRLLHCCGVLDSLNT